MNHSLLQPFKIHHLQGIRISSACGKLATVATGEAAMVGPSGAPCGAAVTARFGAAMVAQQPGLESRKWRLQWFIGSEFYG